MTVKCIFKRVAGAGMRYIKYEGKKRLSPTGDDVLLTVPSKVPICSLRNRCKRNTLSTVAFHILTEEHVHNFHLGPQYLNRQP
jgi:hypothetical protein